ncbi:MAG: TauD/TfdA family dioxygenase [Pseudomonadota bacterium]
MPKPKKNLSENQKIGELSLMYKGEITLGTRPGLIDIWLGEENKRRRIYKEKNIDVKSQGYLDLCDAAYTDFIRDNKDNIRPAISKLEEFYKKFEFKARNFDEINWGTVIESAVKLINNSAIVANSEDSDRLSQTPDKTSVAINKQVEYSEGQAGSDKNIPREIRFIEKVMHHYKPKFDDSFKDSLFRDSIGKEVAADLKTAMLDRLSFDDAPDPYKNPEEAQKIAVEICQKIIPERIQKKLAEIATGIPGSVGIYLIEGLDVGDLPPTPKNTLKPEDKSFYTQYCMLCYLALLNSNIYIATDEKYGQTFHEIAPVEPEAVTSAGYKRDLSLHTENSHDINTPHIIMLLCLRGDPAAKTSYVRFDELLELLDRETIEELTKPNFAMRTGENFDVYSETINPILKFNQFGLSEVRVNTAPGRCKGLTDKAQKALEVFAEIANDNRKFFELKAGEVVIFDNRVVGHGRDAFPITNPNGKERWLRRLYAHLKETPFNETPLEETPPNNIIEPIASSTTTLQGTLFQPNHRAG